MTLFYIQIIFIVNLGVSQIIKQQFLHYMHILESI
jgi:hypothetical protein